jgi:hypothetical protein
VCEGARQWLAKEMANLKEVRKGCLTVRTGGVLAHSCLLVWVGTMSLHTPPPSPSTNPYPRDEVFCLVDIAVLVIL